MLFDPLRHSPFRRTHWETRAQLRRFLVVASTMADKHSVDRKKKKKYRSVCEINFSLCCGGPFETRVFRTVRQYGQDPLSMAQAYG